MGLAGYGARVEGLHAVVAAAAAGRVETLFIEEGRRRRHEVRELIAVVGPDRVRVVDDVHSLAETAAPQGVVAECRPIVPAALDSLAGTDAALMVLDHVEDPQNLGAVARSSLAAGLSGLVISGRRAAPLSAAAFKAAAGALERLPVAVVGSIPEALRRLRRLGVWVVGLEASAEASLFGLELFTEPVAVVVGAEGSGLSRLTAERCDVLVAVPMAEGTESLNASVTAALAAFEIMRVRSGPPG